ncbi:MAG: 50S ribosomal protein L11 methyltransferase [Thermodesulfobacteriota bacterium]
MSSKSDTRHDMNRKWIKTSVFFESEAPEATADLIAGIFQDFGLQGVVIESPGTEVDLDWAEDAPGGPDHNAVIGYFPELADNGGLCRRFENQLAAASPDSGWQYRVKYSEVDEEDWAESWKAHFHPVQITERLVIKPTWQDYEASGDEIVIELDPGMAFGTGTHPTTELCIRMIARYLKPGIRLLDIGSGSGILMIAAVKLGAFTVVGIDSDPVAVEVAESNLRLNGIDPGRFTVTAGNLIDGINEAYDIVVANILSETICELVPDVAPCLAAGGVFIASGIVAYKAPMVTKALEKYGFTVREVEEKDEWVAVVATF